jgi:hypothetical protein
MLNQGNKRIAYLVLITLLTFYCKNIDKDTDKNYQKVSKAVTSGNIYENVYINANDSIRTWLKNNLLPYRYLQYNEWRLDSLICFNKSIDRCVMSIMVKAIRYKTSVQDGLEILYGAKIINQWFFFNGASVVLPREFYQKDIHTPLSFEKMHEIALKEVFGGYLTPEGEINEQFFKDHFENSGWGLTNGKKEDYEKIYLQKVNNNWYWAKKDTSHKELP